MLRALLIGLFLGNVVVYGALTRTWLEFQPHGTTIIYKNGATWKPTAFRPRSIVTDTVWRPVPQWI